MRRTVPAGNCAIMTPAASVHQDDVHVYCCRVNLVLVGAEGVVENGGIINKLGSYHVAIAAKEHRIAGHCSQLHNRVILGC